MADQEFDAKIFCNENQKEIQAVSDRLRAAALDFLNKHGATALSQHTLGSLHGFAEAGDWNSFFMQMRLNAVQFGQAGFSGQYWDIVDANGALGDATGSHWPYMTPAVRSARLQHALEHLNDAVMAPQPA